MRKLYPPLVNAEVKNVLHSSEIPIGLVHLKDKQSEEIETMLEAVMPEEDLHRNWRRWSVGPTALNLYRRSQKQTLIRMMEQLAEAHYQAGQVAQSMADLAKIMQPSPDHDWILKFVARPVVQLEGTLRERPRQTPHRRRGTSRRK